MIGGLGRAPCAKGKTQVGRRGSFKWRSAPRIERLTIPTGTYGYARQNLVDPFTGPQLRKQPTRGRWFRHIAKSKPFWLDVLFVDTLPGNPQKKVERFAPSLQRFHGCERKQEKNTSFDMYFPPASRFHGQTCIFNMKFHTVGSRPKETRSGTWNLLPCNTAFCSPCPCPPSRRCSTWRFPEAAEMASKKPCQELY